MFLGTFVNLWKGEVTLSLTGFVGQEVRKFDQVNRMAIPPIFRKDLGDTIIVLKSIHDDPCLVLFSEQEWFNFSEEVISKFEGKKQAIAQRKLAGMIDKVIPDKSGRITIKDDFKAHAHLQSEVLAVGTANRVELWAPDVWDEWNDAQDISFDNISYSTTGGNR